MIQDLLPLFEEQRIYGYNSSQQSLTRPRMSMKNSSRLSTPIITIVVIMQVPLTSKGQWRMRPVITAPGSMLIYQFFFFILA